MAKILTYIEIFDNEVTDVSLQCLTRGRELAGETGGNIDAVIIGSGVASMAAAIGEGGAGRVYLADHSLLKSYSAGAFKKILADLIKEQSPDLILFPASTQGNDLAAALAADLQLACVQECRELKIAGSTATGVRMEFDNQVLSDYAARGERAAVITCKDGIADVGASASAGGGEQVTLNVSLDENDLLSRVINHEIAKKTVNLKAAKIIVTAGAGIGSKDNYALIEKLADALGGEVGATRPVVDAGWATADRQIGQTGATVKPDLYIACGVSGAVQHRVGMMDSKTVIAINTDAQAPIFKIANYCIVGDLTQVVPKLIKLLGK